MHEFKGPKDKQERVALRHQLPGVPLRDLTNAEYAAFVKAGRIDRDGPTGKLWAKGGGDEPEDGPQEPEAAQEQAQPAGDSSAAVDSGGKA